MTQRSADSRVKDSDAWLGPLLRRLADDPWSLPRDERERLRGALIASQRRWQVRLSDLVEPPSIDDTFPAFLLETPAFEHVRRAIGAARARAELDTAAADLVQRFADRYREYMRTDTAPDPDAMFASVHRDSSSRAGSVTGASHTPRRHR